LAFFPVLAPTARFFFAAFFSPVTLGDAEGEADGEPLRPGMLSAVGPPFLAVVFLATF
jgi:hypothetical protein